VKSSNVGNASDENGGEQNRSCGTENKKQESMETYPDGSKVQTVK